METTFEAAMNRCRAAGCTARQGAPRVEHDHNARGQHDLVEDESGYGAFTISGEVGRLVLNDETTAACGEHEVYGYEARQRVARYCAHLVAKYWGVRRVAVVGADGKAVRS
jgi:hypothetical protein